MRNLFNLLGVPTEQVIIAIVIVIFAFFLVLLILRGFWCWFFKTTEISHFLEEISNKITAQHKSQIAYYENQLELYKKQIEIYNLDNVKKPEEKTDSKPEERDDESQKINQIYE